MAEVHTEELTITRVFDVPRELVWNAWTQCDRFKLWWGPEDFTVPFCNIDLRVGGKYLYSMRAPDGTEVWGTGTYRELKKPELIVATDSFSDEKGNIVPASHYGMTGIWPLELTLTAMFEEHDGKTKITLIHEGIPIGEMREMTRQGWSSSLDKLEKSLK